MEITIDEANAIINKTDPRSDKYYKNDQDLIGAVNDAYRRQHPGPMDDGTERALTENVEKFHPEQAGADEPNPNNPATEAEMKSMWGDQYQANMQRIVDYGAEHNADLDKLNEVAKEWGILDNPKAQAAGLKYLHDLVSNRR